MPSWNAPNIDDARWTTAGATLAGTPSWVDEVTIQHVHCSRTSHNGVVLLIYGFPKTSYQFRHLITPLRDAGTA